MFAQPARGSGLDVTDGRSGAGPPRGSHLTGGGFGGGGGAPRAVLDVAQTPSSLSSERVAASTVLVVDVLRASTTIITAIANGCAGIRPVADPDAARRSAREPGWETALVAGERDGEPPDGFDLGNSPLEFDGNRVRDRIVIFTTTNGTRALLAARHAARIGIASLINLSAASAWAAAHPGDIIALCAGNNSYAGQRRHCRPARGGSIRGISRESAKWSSACPSGAPHGSSAGSRFVHARPSSRSSRRPWCSAPRA